MAGLRDFQQGSHCHRKTWINILFGILRLLLPYVQQGGAQLQALTQMNSVVEVWEAEDADLVVPTQAEDERSSESLARDESSLFGLRDSGRPLSFQPAMLEFGSQPVGLLRAESVYIHNPSQELPVTLLSMFTSSRHFHMSPFHRRVIPPRGKASFKLIFLPTEEGNVECSLFINTSSHGVLSYQVFGVGVNHGSSREVQKKNSVLVFPQIQSIKLTQTQGEAYNVTTLGLLLECRLPKNYYNRSQGSCFLTEEKLTAQISLSEKGDKHTDLEMLKPYVIENIMVLFVIPLGGSTLRVPKMSIYMLNSGVKKFSVKEIQLFSKVESTLEFKQVILRAYATNFTQVASLDCSGFLPVLGKKCNRQISLQILQNYTFKLYPAFGLKHRRLEDGLLPRFHLRQNGGDNMDIWLTNGFSFNFLVNNVTTPQEMDGLLKIVNFSGPVTVATGCWRLFSLQLVSRKLPMSLSTSLVLYTSMGFPLEIPLHIHSSSSSSSSSKLGDVSFGASGECERPCKLRLSEAGHAKWQQSFLPHSSSWSVDSSLASELYAGRPGRKDQLSCSWPRLPMNPGSVLDFGASPVNESKVKYFTLKNPSASPVSVELRALSTYPAPLEALDLLTKWFDISPLSVNVTTAEFTFLESNGQESEKLRLKGADGAVRLLLRPSEVREVGVMFTPAEHKSVTSLVLIRNNLTVLDMVMVRGYGARELLRVGGKLPGTGASLRFNVPQSTLMECRDGLRSNKPLFAIRKSFRVENAGELPLTVMSMNINGYKCQGFGFEVLQCRSFHLDHNSSAEINIAFTPDFTSSWVIRDLTLVTARGSSFPFTLNVTLPHHMLPLCAQAVPGPSWEETFWLVTIVFTCFSLGGVCLMAFHQAQYILTEFSTPGTRSNHNSAPPRDGNSANPISSSSAGKMKGSCKTFVDSCNTSDKGKGKGSLAVASVPVRSQSSTKKASGAPAQPQKKHKVSVYYGKYKVSSSALAAAATASTEEEREDQISDHGPEYGAEMDPDSIDNSNSAAPESPAPTDNNTHFKGSLRSAAEDQELAPLMFPTETHSSFPESTTVAPVGRPGPLACDLAEESHRAGSPLSHVTNMKESRKRDILGIEPREHFHMQRKLPEKAELGGSNGNNKGRKSTGKSRRKPGDLVSGVPEHGVVMSSERTGDLERGARNANSLRNRCPGGKGDGPKARPAMDGHVKPFQNGTCLARPRRRCAERRLQWESGSDSGSSSGSVRASRGSWGSCSSTSSAEGDKDHSGNRHHCTASGRKRDKVQYSAYSAERDCYQTLNSNYKPQSVRNLYRKDPCLSLEPVSVPSFIPSFAAVAAGVDRNLDVNCPYQTDEAWSAPSLPLTNEFRYNTTESVPLVPQGSSTSPSSSYNGFLWSNANSQCASSYPYCDQRNYMLGNTNFENGFTYQENQSVACSPQPCWGEDGVQEAPSAWDTTGCVGSKPYFSGTRSLSPMSSLFGSIWTPQTDPCQSPFQPERSVPPSPESPFAREPGGTCRPMQYSSFNPFGPHMNLDIWNSSSNRISNSQLSNDCGYCGDV